MATTPQAAAQAQLGYAQAMEASKAATTEAYNKARGDLTDNDYYASWYGNGQNANTMYANALGLNGAGGSTAAQKAFQTSPGYDWQVQQGLDALNRTAASRGGLAGGGQSIALQNYGQQMANQQWQNWLSGLNTASSQGMTAAAGKTGQQNALANLDYGYGKDLSSIYMNGTQQAMGALQNGNQQQPDSSSGIMSAILGGLNLASKVAPMFMASDARLKTDIAHIGALDNGLPVYQFRYKDGGPVQIGLMAQDVEKVRPSAVVERGDGMKMVNYAEAAT